jgi:hypothetical protein
MQDAKGAVARAEPDFGMVFLHLSCREVVASAQEEEQPVLRQCDLEAGLLKTLQIMGTLKPHRRNKHNTHRGQFAWKDWIVPGKVLDTTDK